MERKKIVVVGAGPGGLTAAMLLASRGYHVDVFEKQDRVGGRNAALEFDGYTFDLGPTFLMMTFILAEMFEFSGRRMEDYLDLKPIDPYYRLRYGDGSEFFPTPDRNKMKEQMDLLFPGEYAGYEEYLRREKIKYDRLIPCLQIPYGRFRDLASPRVARAAPYLDAHKSLYDHLGRYFKDPRLKIAFTFQAKYLGMSPWKCPGIFSIISFIEHSGGIHHPVGGLNAISRAMARVLEEEGGRIHLSHPVEEILVERKKAVGVRLAGGEIVRASDVILNADFAHALTHLIQPEHLSRWHPDKLRKKDYSCSTFMLYLGLDKLYDIPHHNILFAPDYRKNVEEIAEKYVLSEDPSIYVQNASITDSTLAPKGHSTLYVLVPIANNKSRIPWNEVKDRYREKVLDLVETRGGLPDLRKHITAERLITPLDWEQSRSVYQGATFNLAHSLDQMLYFRPHNRFEEIDRLWLVGGGTHPGSGLPTIYESGRISVGLILRRDGF